MNQLEKSSLAIAEMGQDSAAMVGAALAGDFDEARFRAHLIAAKADTAGLPHLAVAAAYICDRLGPTESAPRDGYGAAMLRVADELDRLGFKPI